MNPAIDIIREATRGTPYEGHLYLVGGVVRDEVMGYPPAEDVDIVLEGDALELARFLYKKKVTDHKPVIYPRFGTAMVVIQGHTAELVSARRESYVPVSRKPEVEPADLYDDMLRRDFTINTLLKNLHTNQIHDLTGMGIADIRAGVIRTPTEPATTFYDDPLRMLRAVRFAVRLEFEIDRGTWDAILRDAPRLCIISGERIRDEFVKILLSDKATRGLVMLKESGLLAQFAPEFMPMQGVTQTGGHIYDVWEHTLRSLDVLPPQVDLTARLAVLFHDIEKPKTKSVDVVGKVHFFGHEALSAETTRRIMNRLRFPKSETARVFRLISMHMRIGEYKREWSDGAVRRLMRDAGVDMSDLLALAIADRMGASPHASTDDLRELEGRMETVLRKIRISEFRSPLNGKEIMALLNLPPGPKVQEVKDFLVNAVIEERLHPKDKETARKLVLEEFGGR